MAAAAKKKATKKSAAYTEESIRTLEAKEHIRMRPGMYIGKLGDGAEPIAAGNVGGAQDADHPRMGGDKGIHVPEPKAGMVVR